ncbi:sigma-70 family RNA polymerase sigma factor [Stieleria sp. JC731]|uniref:sigma-70 family RNA polymerase sigma factor n=1 Tax=Pirellulaceae TaxID=2691357 RepID=UPI001E5B3C7B|nr:sigma-70 family RNA polymerase sigma factor [Stieleria sp. JC731]MCC9602157.1 sigma-70 family RNA polymerase sigma factor [Stieleria sp. JC731]
MNLANHSIGEEDSSVSRHSSPSVELESIVETLEFAVDQFGDSLYRYAFRKTGCDASAEELLQETFLAALASGKSFRNESTLSTWLFAILKHKLADHFRKLQRSPNTDPATIAEDEIASARSSKQTPETIFENDEFWETFHGCVDRLPNKLAEVFILREINQHSPKEIRELLGIGATNLSMRLNRCRLALRECLNLRWFSDRDQ